MTTPNAHEIADRLTEAQKHFARRASHIAQHPYDIVTAGTTAKAMIRRQLAFRALCTYRTSSQQFNGYGLTPLGLEVRQILIDRARKEKGE